MAKRKYRPTKGARFGKKDAQVIGETLDVLGDSVTAEEVVRSASKKTSKIHKFFTWNDTLAAAKYRLTEARYMLRHIEVEIEGKAYTKARHHVYVESEDREAYVGFARVRRTGSMRRQVIQQALRELESMQSRYQEYSEIFGPVTAAIKKVKKTIPRKKAA